MLRDYTSRKEEIEARKEKKAGGRGGEGKRVKGRKVRELVEELWRRHGECDYWKMRAVCCASKVSEETWGGERRGENEGEEDASLNRFRSVRTGGVQDSQTFARRSSR